MTDASSPGTSSAPEPHQPPTTSAPRPRPRRIIGKWSIMGGFWLVQAAFLGAIVPMWGFHAGSVNDPQGNIVGRWEPRAIAEVWSNLEAAVVITGVIGILTLSQGALLWPVRRPRLRTERGVSLIGSMAAAGLAAAFLSTACLVALVGLMQLLETTEAKRVWDSPVTIGAVLVWGAVSWTVFGVLLHRFYTRRLNAGGKHEDILHTIASRLFMGTVVETVAIIPLDIMLRRKTNCYCETGTFWAISFCFGVGTFALGPAVLLALLSRRRKGWYAARCDSCGYDMSALLTATRVIDRCPECGAGWKAETQHPPLGPQA